MNTGQLIEKLAAVFAVVIIAGGCLLVLAPFISALLWGAILAYCTWAPYRFLAGVLGGRRWLAAGLMVLTFIVVLVGPFVGAGVSLVNHSGDMVAAFHRWTEGGVPSLPEWVSGLPLVGAKIQLYWLDLSQGGHQVMEELRKFAAPALKWLLGSGALLGQGVLYMLLSIVLAYFFYSGGEGAVAWLSAGMRRVAGDERGEHLLQLIGNTVRGVVYGILGSCLAQGALTAFGLAISGVPAAAALGLLTFFLSVLPGGPMLVWVPAVFWLGSQGDTGWAVFLALWGILAISTVDNFIKPFFIGKGSDMPFILILLGVLGGAMAFGVLGVFIGPTLLAVGYTVLREWTVRSEAARFTT
jgi:predicted PurR-regulated permease PerM